MSDNPPPQKRMAWKQPAILIIIGVMLALVIVEIAGRALRLLPVAPPESYYHLQETLGEFPRPYEYFTYDSPIEGEFSNFVQFNYRGLRDIDHSYALPNPDTVRLMFLGDSFTAGWEVAALETYPARLREALSQLDDPTQYDIINAGFHAWGTDRQYLYYREEGKKYNSQLVALQVYAGNDITDNGVGLLRQETFGDGIVVFNRQPLDPSRPYFTLSETGQLLYHPPTAIPQQTDTPLSLKAWLNQNLFTYQLARNAVRNLTANPQAQTGAPAPAPDLPDRWTWLRDTPYAPEFETNPDWNIARQLTEKLILALKREVEAHGGAFLILLARSSWENDPQGWQERLAQRGLPGTWDPARPAQRLIAFFRQENIPYLDTFPYLQNYEKISEQPVHYKHDGHWNKTGHCVVAVALQNWLIEEGFIPAPQPYSVADATQICNDL